ncbi:MAG: ribonuclease III [Phycisphaerae bacterium]|nr:ribonuclease III [Phycisphaerae bacterium]
MLDYRFQDVSLLETALIHASAASGRLNSNERMEFFGDAVLGMVVCEELYRRFPQSHEGDLTKIKSVVVSRQVCANIAEELGLDDLLVLGKGMCDRSGLPMSLKAAVIEAVVAAVYLDGGLEEVRNFILKHVTAPICEVARSHTQRNYKSSLQQYAQQILDSSPQYESLDEQGPDHSKCFEICVSIKGRRFPSAWGTSKKEAEQKAALLALRELKVIPTDNDEV